MSESFKVTPMEALKAMILFWNDVYERTESAEIGAVLGDLSILPDGATADPAAYNDFMVCLRKVINGDDQDAMLNIR